MEKLVLFGCGGFAKNHVRELLKRDEVEISFIVDPSAENRRALTEQYTESGKPAPEEYASPEEFFEANPSFDAAVIVSPPETHYGIAKKIIESGKPVYVEKPFTQTSDEAKELAQLSKDGGIEVEIGANRCVFLAYRAGAIALREGKVGETESISMYYRHNWEGNTRGNWRQNPDNPNSGLLADHSPHYMHYLCTDLGFKPAQARHLGTRFNEEGVDVDTCYELRDQAGKPAYIIMEGSPGDDERKEVMTIRGSEGTIVIKFEGKASSAYVEKDGTREPIDTSAALEEIKALGIEDYKSHPALIHNFVGLITGEVNQNANPAEEGILPVYITELVRQSRGETREDSLTKPELAELSAMVDDGGQLDPEIIERFYDRGQKVDIDPNKIELTTQIQGELEPEAEGPSEFGRY